MKTRYKLFELAIAKVKGFSEICVKDDKFGQVYHLGVSPNNK
jgi:hypothetical protein